MSVLTENALHIDVHGLIHSYPGQKPVLQDLDMQLTGGARCLLVGANGAGKSTLLRILAGRHMTKPDDSVKILGRSAFHDNRLNFERAYLDTDWGMRTVAFAGYGCPLQADIGVSELMMKLQAEFPARREELIELLGIDLNWRMHQVSDGQRRRVQIFIGLLRPFKILLLDEVTVSLDVIVRMDLLKWLKRESETTGCTILYATHIFDGLDDWPTHLHYLSSTGKTGWQGTIEECDLYKQYRVKGETSPLLRVAEHWLRADLTEKKLLKIKSGESNNEKPEGAGYHASKDPTQAAYNSGGGFSAGRMASYDFITGK